MTIPIVLVLGEDKQAKEFLDVFRPAIWGIHTPYRCKESEEDALKRCDFVLIFENQSFPRRSKRTGKIIDLSQVDLGNGGAVSVPPRMAVEMMGISVGPLPTIRPHAHEVGLYGMCLDGTGFRLNSNNPPSYVATVFTSDVKTVLVSLPDDHLIYPRFGQACAQYVVLLIGELLRRNQNQP